MEYEWTRNIKLRQLGKGCQFSTYLGRYFNTTSQLVKKNKKYEFKYTATEDSLLLGISVDLFYEDLRFVNYKYLVEKSWKTYLQRVKELNRIINGIGTMKPNKKDVEKSLKDQLEEKELR